MHVKAMYIPRPLTKSLKCYIYKLLIVYFQLQYVFIHDALNELITCGETDIAANSLRIVVNRLSKHAKGKEISGFLNQFEVKGGLSVFHKMCFKAHSPLCRSWSSSLPSWIAPIALKLCLLSIWLRTAMQPGWQVIHDTNAGQTIEAFMSCIHISFRWHNSCETEVNRSWRGRLHQCQLCACKPR